MALTAMGRRLGLTPASMTSPVDRLEGAGYVARTAHPVDRRVIEVSLQPATLRAFDHLGQD